MSSPRRVIDPTLSVLARAPSLRAVAATLSRGTVSPWALAGCALAGCVLAGCVLAGCASDDPASMATGSLADAEALDGASDAGSTGCPTGLGFLVMVQAPADLVGADGGSAERRFEARGAIVASAPGSFTLARCPPGESCALAPATIAVGGTQFAPVLPLGAFVDVSLRLSKLHPMAGDSIELAVRSLPSWGDTPNPVTSWGGWYLLVAEGLDSAPGSAPFVATPLPLACDDASPDWRNYSIRFSDGAAEANVAPGGSRTATLAGQEWRLTVARALEPVATTGDPPAPFSWWAEGIAP